MRCSAFLVPFENPGGGGPAGPNTLGSFFVMGSVSARGRVGGRSREAGFSVFSVGVDVDFDLIVGMDGSAGNFGAGLDVGDV